MRFSRHQLNTVEILQSTTGLCSHQLPQFHTNNVILTAIVLRIYTTKTVPACFAVLLQLRIVHRSISKSVLQFLVMSLVLIQDTAGLQKNATLASILLYLLKQLQ